MNTLAETDIVNSATPLEMHFVDVHPRLYATADELAAIRERVAREPWSGFLARVRRVADGRVKSGPLAADSTGDRRGAGCGLAHIAAAYTFTQEQQYLDAAAAQLAGLASIEDWTTSLEYGHWAHGAALAYDWLHHELPADLLADARAAIARASQRIFNYFANYESATSTGYGWNHMAVIEGGLMAAGCAVWAEVDGAGKWLRQALEKLRLMVDTLGPDGASPEGLAYGQYHHDFLLKAMWLGRQLLGVDMLADCAFYRAYPNFMLYSSLPSSVWEPNVAFVHLGDNCGHHWYGPDPYLRLCAREYRDGRSQWLANALTDASANADSSCFLNLLWHDDTVSPQPPDDLPLQHHLADKDMVMMRSDWSADASVAVLRCGPNSGYHADGRYGHDTSGGHMHPDAGHFILHGCGDWLVIDDGYQFKQTSYQNTVLVNGIGQTGEGFVWFEDLEFRQGKAEGRILRADYGDSTGIDCVIADAAPPYRADAQLTKFLRHLFYVRPNVWVLVDELEAAEPSEFDRRFHTPGPVERAGDNAWTMTGERGGLWIADVSPVATHGRDEIDAMVGASSNHPDRDVNVLRLLNSDKTTSAVFVTVLHAFDVKTRSEDQRVGDNKRRRHRAVD